MGGKALYYSTTILLKQANEENCNLERECRDCIKSRRDKITICLVIPILSLLQSLYSLSKLHLLV